MASEDTPADDESCSRRAFLQRLGGTTAISAATLAGIGSARSSPRPPERAEPGIPISDPDRKAFTVERVDLAVEREVLAQPYGFKGTYITDGWQTVALLESSSHRTIGLGRQSPPWADMSVAAARTPTGANAVMLSVTERALQLVQGKTFEDPIEMTEWLYPRVREYARSICRQEVSANFALNALVPVDNAAWLLYARENGISDFETMIPERYRHTLDSPNDQVASIPSLTYNTTPDQVEDLIDRGYFIMKMKIGQPGPPEEMLEKDKAHIEKLHETLSAYSTEHTPDGQIPYYFDANMRYEKKEHLVEFLDHMKKIGAFDQILVVEDPFPEEVDARVDDLGVRVSTDEPASTPERARKQLDRGYSAIAQKPVAKTFSMTLKVLDVAQQRDIPCYCADLMVSPTLREWNKMVAARVGPMPMIDMGMFETNGHQYYADWDRMLSYHPYPDSPWTEARNGVFKLGDDYYEKNGGILDIPQHYLDLVEYQAQR